MAHARLTGNRDWPFFYNVDHAVGPNAPNRRDDVFLVQTLLRGIQTADAYRRPNRPNGGVMAIDGTFGPITAEAIVHFQTVSRALGENITIDGRVDRCNIFGRGPLTGAPYTILRMNRVYQQNLCGDLYTLPFVNECPPELSRALLHF
jgi:hypothetical protein